MKGGISLKDFILGVKKELQAASTEGSANPFLKLTQVELEAEFGLDAKGGVGFDFFVKIDGETTAKQMHKVKLVFSPIQNNFMLALSPPDLTDKAADELPGFANRSGKPNDPTPPGQYIFQLPAFGVSRTIDIDEIVKQAVLKTQFSKKDTKGSGEDGA